MNSLVFAVLQSHEEKRKKIIPHMVLVVFCLLFYFMFAIPHPNRYFLLPVVENPS